MPADGPIDQYPERRAIDTVADMAKALVASSVPGAAALATLIRSSHVRRLEEFHRRTAHRLDALEQATVSTLLQRATEGDEDAREEIFSTYATISRLILESMDDEKRKALASAMASSLLSPDEQEIERRYFLRCLADFETIHIHVIVRAAQGVQSVRELVNDPGMLGDNAKVALTEINDRGLIELDRQSVNAMMTPTGMAQDRTTPLGKRFLRFIGRDEF